MNSKTINFLKNFSYTLASNLISLLISTLVTLIIPRLIGVEEYGYWQLYLFYSSYLGFLHFGWIDGIYLRYGGDEYNELNRKLFFSQFIMLLLSQLIIGMIIWISTSLIASDMNRNFIVKMIALALVIVNSRAMILFILQATNRIKDYARITMLDRILYVILIILFLMAGIRDYKLMITADLIGKFLSLIFAMYCCKEIVFNKFSLFYFTIGETVANTCVGIKLMFANIASILIIGIIRLGIERTWDVATFGKVSLTLSISNMTMLFINAVGIIMYPILRRTEIEKLPAIYTTMRDFLMVILLGVLVIYYPVKTLMSAWLPKYAESLMYMALVFPMFIYEGKMALLINTYLKTLRKEKVMLKINLLSMVLSLILTLLTTQVLKSLDLTILNIVVLLIFRSILAELYLARGLKISVKKDILLELLLTAVFIISGWFVNSWYTVLIYIASYLLYIILKAKDVTMRLKSIKSLVI
ncbi:MAG: hypothetical protein AAGU39_07620 [Sedimentibacter saalensis]|uniref:lipopolysaccharide biosynthesis protein n=1 Tax=Sedimentibacter saalensis TaxID=130788 RepID=UPI0031585131